MSLIQSDDDISSEEINTEGLGQGSSNPNATHDNPFFIAEEWIQDNSFKHGDAADETPPGYNTLQIRDPTDIINGNVNHSPKTKDTLSNKSKDHEGVREATEIEEPVGERILHDELEGKLTFWLALSTATVSIGSGCQLGYNGGGFSVPAPFVQEFLNHTNHDKWGGAATDVLLTWIYSCTVSMFLVGAAFGSMVAGRLSDIRGRKGSLLITNFLSIAGSLLIGFCQLADIYGLLVLGRFVLGLYVGTAVCIMPIYLAEIAPINLRGSIGVFSALMVTAGTVIAHILYFAFCYTQTKWVIVAALTGAFSLFELAVLPFCPESPRWLLINRNNPIEAKKALQKLRGTQDVKNEMEEMRLEAEQIGKSDNVTVMDILKLKRPEWKMPLILSVSIMCGVHLSGFSTVMYYTTAIYESAGMNATEIAFATVGFSTLNMLMTGVSVLVVERVGRRPLLLYPFLVMGLCLIGLTVSIGLGTQEKYDWMKWLSIVFVYIDISAYALGPMSIKNLVATELWLQGPRPAAMSISFQLNYWCSVFISLTFPVFDQQIGSYTFLIYLGFLLITVAIVFFYFPETKNKTFDEINAYFIGGSGGKPYTVTAGPAIQAQTSDGGDYEMRDFAAEGAGLDDGGLSPGLRRRAYSALSAVSSQGQFSKNVPGTQWL